MTNLDMALDAGAHFHSMECPATAGMEEFVLSRAALLLAEIERRDRAAGVAFPDSTAGVPGTPEASDQTRNNTGEQT